MSRLTYILLNSLLHIFHLTMIFFCLFGWIFSETRLAHFGLVLLILGSWFGLGLFFGFGYCPITDLQWRVKREYGEMPSTEYYVKYMIDKITGRDNNPKIVNNMTTYVLLGLAVISTILNLMGIFLSGE